MESSGVVTSDLVLWLILGVFVLIFGTVYVLVMGKALARNPDSEGVQKAFILALIIIAAVFFVVIVTDVNKLAPIIGLLGAIAGHVMTKSSRRAN